MITNFLQILENIIGRSYTPVTYEAYRLLQDGSYEPYDIIPSGLAGVDVPWLISAVLYILLIYCTVRLIGGILRR